MLLDDEKQSEVADDDGVSSSVAAASTEHKMDDTTLCVSLSPRSTNTLSHWSSSSLGSIAARDSILSRVTRGEPRWLRTASDQSISPLITPRSLESAIPLSRRRAHIQSGFVRSHHSSDSINEGVSESSSSSTSGTTSHHSQRSSQSSTRGSSSSNSSTRSTSDTTRVTTLDTLDSERMNNDLTDSTTTTMTVRPNLYTVGTLDLVLGDTLRRFVDSTDLYRRCISDISEPMSDAESESSVKSLKELRRRLFDDGYVFIRGVIPKHLINKAIKVVAQKFDEYFECMAPEPTLLEDPRRDTAVSSTSSSSSLSTDHRSGMESRTGSIPIMKMRDKYRDRKHLLTGFTPITHTDEVLDVVQSAELIRIIALLLNTKSVGTLDTKWLRIVGFDQNTDEHSDFYRFSHYYDCADDFELFTCWVPLMDVPLNKGPLAVCVGSHALEFEKATKSDDGPTSNEEGESEEEENDSEGSCELPAGFPEFAATIGQWRTHDFEAGDIVLFNSKLVHASLKNRAECYRVSIDTRWLKQQHSDSSTVMTELPIHSFNATFDGVGCVDMP